MKGKMMQSGKTIKLLILLVITLVVLSDNYSVGSQANKPQKTRKEINNRWEKTIQNFEDWDSKNSYPLNAVLFVGSSSIKLWPTRDYFPEYQVINRGFGGSHISDSNYFAHRIVLPYKPKVIVFYAGDNDIAGKKTAQRVFADYRKFVQLVHKKLENTRIIFVGIKPSGSRWSLWPQMKKVNLMIKKFSDKDKRLFYFDSASPLLGNDGKPDAGFFLKDKLHLNKKGYDVWTSKIKPIVKKAFDKN
jgi:hypothetical protein